MLSHQRAFLVVVHDIAPHFLRPLVTIGRELRHVVGGAVAGAVVPHWHGDERSDQHAPLVAYLQETVGEVLLHGYSHNALHQQGLVSLLTDGANELSGSTCAEARHRLRCGRALLEASLGISICGFVPPAWQPGPVTPELLADCGLEYMLGFWQVTLARGWRHALAVWSWDCGRSAGLGLLGERLGWLRLRGQPNAVPCVVVHPRDVTRGYLVRALHVIDQLLAAGWRPMLPSAYLRARLNTEEAR
jgi:hypothetical protein